MTNSTAPIRFINARILDAELHARYARHEVIMNDALCDLINELHDQGNAFAARASIIQSILDFARNDRDDAESILRQFNVGIVDYANRDLVRSLIAARDFINEMMREAISEAERNPELILEAADSMLRCELRARECILELAHLVLLPA